MRRSALVPYSAEQMFDLIEQVEHYPRFLPWCTRTQLIERTDEIVSATVEVGFRELHVRVTTRNEKRRPEWMAIHMQDGSFRHFFGEWKLLPLGTLGCRIDFSLRYELAMHTEKLAGPLIDRAANQMVDAFVRRAEVVYDSTVPDAGGGHGPADEPGQPAGS
ncbi:MAG: type II toxin-antitoxin system RatA family toxin [Betaproteobacteria bacterium]